jgi:DNA-binding PadR family transcriptional regulator
MSPRSEAGPQLLPLSVPVFQILLSLSNRELHGYALISDIRRRTDGEVDLTPSTLYGALRRLEQEGLVAPAEERPDPLLDDARRRYFRITDSGRGVVRAEARRLERSLEQARAMGLVGGTSEPLPDRAR